MATYRDLWAVYFAQVVAMEMHPGNRRLEDVNLAKCANQADRMLDETNKRFPHALHQEESQCQPLRQV